MNENFRMQGIIDSMKKKISELQKLGRDLLQEGESGAVFALQLQNIKRLFFDDFKEEVSLTPQSLVPYPLTCED